ncbi:MAG: histidine kinase dimerization/phosphoacceptor domain -containing protein [Thermoplasmata archaeon]
MNSSVYNMNVMNLYIELTNRFIGEIAKEISKARIIRVKMDLIEEAPLLYDEDIFDTWGRVVPENLRERTDKVKVDDDYLLKTLRYYNKRLIDAYGEEIMPLMAYEKYNECYESIKKKCESREDLMELLSFLPEEVAIDDRIDMSLEDEMKEKFKYRIRQFMESKDRYKLLFDSIGQPVFVLDLDLNLVEMNPGSFELFSGDHFNVLGTNIVNSELFDETNGKKFRNAVQKIIDMEEEIVTQTYEIRSDGEERILEITSTGLVRQGDVLLIINVCRDITQRVYLEMDLKESLEEKKVLLKEIHHRVKNNMQIILSILDRQSRYFDSEEIDEVVLETRNRIMSMSMLHNKLYRSENLTRIRCPEYCADLAKHVINTYKTGETYIRLRTDIEPVLLDLDTLIPMGIIITELVSNSMKHAFEGRDRGEIAVVMRSIDGRYELIVGDDGGGIPPDHRERLGLSLVRDLVDQIDGTLEIGNGNGAVFKIKFDIGGKDG